MQLVLDRLAGRAAVRFVRQDQQPYVVAVSANRLEHALGRIGKVPELLASPWMSRIDSFREERCGLEHGQAAVLSLAKKKRSAWLTSRNNSPPSAARLRVSTGSTPTAHRRRPARWITGRLTISSMSG